MHIVITGGNGFVGQALSRKLLDAGEVAVAGRAPVPVSQLTVIDHVEPPVRIDDPRVVYKSVDITDAAALAAAFNRPADLCIHLAAIVSANAEADFDLGWSVNVDGTRHLLEILRHQGNTPRVVFASSLAVFGGDMPDPVHDGIALWPQTSYGAQKTVGELMVADYARKRFIDGFSLRLPTVVVRPGKPNKAASTFASSIIREPLAGEEVICPVSPESEMFIASPRSIVASFMHAVGLDGDRVGPHKAWVLPGITVSIGTMVDALRKVAGDSVANRVVWQQDPAIQKIVDGWAPRVTSQRALELGFPQDADFESIVAAHIEDHVPDFKPA
jgi:nucleoside-diphosphate-sugar epimerase